MSANERKLAEFILNNATLLRDYSSQQLAEAVGVSQSSVVKFSQKLGYRGYPALKLAVSEELARGSAQIDLSQIPAPSNHEGADTIFEELAQTKADVVKTIAELNSENSLLDVVRTIEKANRIQFVAAGGYSLVVKDFALKLMIMGKSVVAESDPFVQRANLASMRRGDVLFALSVSGQNGHVIELAEAAKEAGLTIVSLTKYDVNPLSLLADHSLFTLDDRAASQYSASAPHIVARVALQHLIDALYMVLSSRDTHGRELLILSQQAVENL
ncbi:MurR/RpiR family transcriptional regulator [Kordiimonas aestuarii]|uniref:MurR/RpiR family transcriptional regulator n=1 Tax=Kordiimonas aestuarii TaxID=1005925 RepID=UPI0021D2DAEB|nr:MurR/RpiR family transcriptional regulator [Kordiimonas aestuarii]